MASCSRVSVFTPRRQDAETPRRQGRQESQQEHFCSLACVRYSVPGGEALFEVTRKTIATPYSRFFKQRRLGESEAERKD